MTNTEKVLAYLRSIAPTEATNGEIVRRTGVKPHQQVFQITQSLMAQRAIRGSQAGGEWRFWVDKGSSRMNALSPLPSTGRLPEHGSGREAARRNLEEAFHEEMLAVYRSALRECGYRATRFLQEVNERGGLATAKYLLQKPGLSDGLTALSQHGRLDVSMEALVLREPWCSLFSQKELATAKTRLRQLNYSTD